MALGLVVVTSDALSANFEILAPSFQLSIFVREQANMALSPITVSHRDGDTSLNPSDANATSAGNDDTTLSPGYANETALGGRMAKTNGEGKTKAQPQTGLCGPSTMWNLWRPSCNAGMMLSQLL